MPISEEYPQVEVLFRTYLDTNKHRKTPERFAVLEEIYTLGEHFDVERLYTALKDRGYRVSRATVYNTLDLLLSAGLVTRHKFRDGMATYERSHGFKQHDHLICSQCAKVFEFCDPRIGQIKAMMGSLLGFEVQGHSLTLNALPIPDSAGSCNRCGLRVSGA